MRQSILRHFGLNRLGMYQGELFLKYKREIIDAVNNREMLAITGEPGAGKSVLFNAAVRDLSMDSDIKFVSVNDWFRERLTIANIMNAIIEDLDPTESPRRCLEARSRQTIRILGEQRVRYNKKIVIILEQGHRLHISTLISLKELREATYLGKDKLCSVILLGHEAMKTKMSKRNEIFLRTDFLDLNESEGWMDYPERVKLIEAVYGEAVTETARKRVASRKRTPLEIHNYLKGIMKDCMAGGFNVVDHQAVEPSLQELKDDFGFSYAKIAKEAGLSKGSVINAFNGDSEHNVPIVKEAIERLRNKQLQDIII